MIFRVLLLTMLAMICIGDVFAETWKCSWLDGRNAVEIWHVYPLERQGGMAIAVQAEDMSTPAFELFFRANEVRVLFSNGVERFFSSDTRLFLDLPLPLCFLPRDFSGGDLCSRERIGGEIFQKCFSVTMQDISDRSALLFPEYSSGVSIYRDTEGILAMAGQNFFIERIDALPDKAVQSDGANQ